MLPMAVARFSSGGVVIRYVLPVLWMTIFAHEPRLLDVAAQLKRSAHIALGLAINCAQQYQLKANARTLGTTFRAPKVTSAVATPGAESAVYDCLVLDCKTKVPVAKIPSINEKLISLTMVLEANSPL